MSVAAPLLALTALVTFVLWDTGAEDWGDISFPCTGIAFVASAWAIFVAPSRRLQLLAVVALGVTIVTAVLWYQALVGILKTT